LPPGNENRIIVPPTCVDGLVDRRVVDKTCLAGPIRPYALLQKHGPSAARPRTDNGPNIDQALQEQLGLKLALPKAPVDVRSFVSV
jgi:uncharacterized protein (TIGR03435 family)